MTVQLGVVMDPIESINIKKDSTFAMLLEARRRGHTIFMMQQNDLFIKNGIAFAMMHELDVWDDESKWFEIKNSKCQPLSALNIILMRKDPPFDMEYIYTTQLLALAERDGVIVSNRPQSLRDANEKLFTTHFPQYCPATLVTRNQGQLLSFIHEYQDVVVKPLDGMGGASIFRLKHDDPNINVVLELLTQDSQKFIMAQRFIPEITGGDKRLLIVDGKPVPYVLARIPRAGETRGNLARGATAKPQPASNNDLAIANAIGPTLKAMGLTFVGIDIIGDYLTEINITSPTGICELDKAFNLNIAGLMFDGLGSIK